MNCTTQTKDIKKIYDVLDLLAGSLFITGLQSHILYSNSSILVRTGYSAAESIGKRPRDLWGGAMGRDFYDQMWQIIRERKKPFSAEVLNTHKNSGMFEETVYIAPIFSQDCILQGFLDFHPFFGDGRSPAQFQTEFLEIFSKTHTSAHEVLSWALPWALEHRSDVQALEEVLKIIKKENWSFSQFVSKVLVNPTKVRFWDREEDSRLVHAAQQDRSQFHKLYTKYYHDILHYFLLHLNNSPDLAQELTQETFLCAFKNIEHFKISNASYKTYLIRIAHNILLNSFRSSRTVSLESLPEDLILSDSRSGSTQIVHTIWKSLSILTTTQQKIFTMKYKEGYLIREISTILQISENAVKLHLCRARKTIKEYLHP